MEKLISSRNTKFKKYEKDRNTNIKVASNAIDGVVLDIGEEFSFNDVLGERTKGKGYKEAHSIDNKKIVTSVGGGICQVSTTLNMAVKDADLKINEVHIHSIPIDYAKREDEAAVSWGEKDYRFTNDKFRKIKINSNFDEENGILTINLYEIL